MVDNFNGKYKSLNSMQRNLLKEYVNNISNTNKLREFINSEVVKIKQILNKILPRVSDDITKIKLTEAIKQTDTLSKGKIVKDKQVVSLMRYYELIKELHNVTG
jgi:phosphomevalonate kinase